MRVNSTSVEALKKLISEKGGKDVYCRSLFLSARWFVLADCADEGLHMVLLPNEEAAQYCASDLYNLVEGDRVFYLPALGTGVERSNYKSSLDVQRTSAVDRILSHKAGELTVIVTYPEALEELVPSGEVVEQSRFTLTKGDEFAYDSLISKLSKLGFERVDFVSSPGQFAVRGSIIDLFSYADNEAYRISFWGDEIEHIHIFNCNTQLSTSEVESVQVISSVLCESESSVPMQSLFELLPSEDTLLWLDSSDMYKDREFFPLTSGFRKVWLELPLDSNVEDAVGFELSPQPVFGKNFEFFTSDVRSRIEHGYKVLIYGEKKTQTDRLEHILIEENCPLPEFLPGKNIHNGFIDEQDKVCHYTDHEIFDRFHRVRIRRSVEKTEQLTLNDLASFNVGDYIVHIDHGVGIFGGLVRLRDDKGQMKEAVKLTYKDGDVVFVSVHALNKISRFRPKDGEAPRINKLGSKMWSALKSGAKKRVKDIAKDLIRLYAKRKASKGFAFSADSYLQSELESSFMYDDTPDQEEATRAVKSDMEAGCPMDRLICGDVGFGKTEIAVRAAFKAATDGKQVAVLVPTTILALQHYNTFSSRLKDFPVNVDYVSRLRTAKELNDIKQRLKTGKIDIIIGTHKILSESFEFKDFGLLIIDEEQKFGVAAKEKLRKLREGVDTLTLSATPIPRTLQFSLLGARDLSIIATPPSNRIPIQTEIILFEEKEIKSIIEYELNRGGQVFFVHNNVEQLPGIEGILQRLVPDMKICTVHGQMSAKETEDKMLDFVRGDYDLLLCTTIIENGLDISNANTIIVNMAQNIGLSDLHQLRGRVGRSNRKAFCYLIVPPLVTLTDEARKRLKAIEEFSDLGSGFNIAMQDLDIRGAGNMLGAEQSGFISDMGYETYQKILTEAMEELGIETGESISGSSRALAVSECSIETDRPAYIPDSYIDITSEKIRIYKQLDAMTFDAEIDNMHHQLTDRFGECPEELENLFNVVKVRNLGAKLGFEKIIIKDLFVCFFPSNPLTPYYKSDVFYNVISKLGSVPSLTYKEDKGKPRIVGRGIKSIGDSLELLKKLQ